MHDEEFGTLVNWHEARAFSFIRPDGNGGDLFVHLSSFPAADREKIAVGKVVGFRRGTGRDGRPCAVDCVLQVPVP